LVTRLILEGTAPTQAELDQALLIAGRTGLQVVNRLQVTRAESTLINSVINSIGIPGVTATGNARSLVLHGVVPDTNAAIRAEQVALSYATEVQNLLQTPNPLLVNVDVSVVEINKTKFRNLGVAFPGLAETTPGFGGGQIIGGIGVGSGPSTSFGTSFQATLRALVDNNNARILSNPRTTVLSGRTAGFLVGGQIPVPVGTTTNENGTTISIGFKDFGILVNVIPVANPDGVITMRVFTDVSQIDNSVGFDFPFGGSTIPGFTKRTAASEVTVQTGGTIALSGLMNNNVTQAVRRVPVLSRIPILGALFTSKSFQRNETELVFFITPRLLPNPLRPGQTAPVTVINALDNQGTPQYGTGALQVGASTLTPGSSDGRGDLGPVASGGGLTIQGGETTGGGSAGGSSGGGD
jgi:pilus assembly protein CpaC